MEMFSHDRGLISIVNSRAAAYRDPRSGRLGRDKYERKGLLAPRPKHIPLPPLRVTKSDPFSLSVHIHLLFLTGPALTLIKYIPNLITPQFRNLEWLPTTYQKRCTQIPPSSGSKAHYSSLTSLSGPTSHRPPRVLKGPFFCKAFVNLWGCVRALIPLNPCRLGSPAVEAPNSEGSMLECIICITVLLLPCTS